MRHVVIAGLGSAIGLLMSAWAAAEQPGWGRSQRRNIASTEAPACLTEFHVFAGQPDLAYRNYQLIRATCPDTAAAGKAVRRLHELRRDFAQRPAAPEFLGFHTGFFRGQGVDDVRRCWEEFDRWDAFFGKPPPPPLPPRRGQTVGVSNVICDVIPSSGDMPSADLEHLLTPSLESDPLPEGVGVTLRTSLRD